MLSLTKNFSDILKKTESLDWHYVVKIEQTADAHVNLLLNPGFEDSTGADFDDWTEDGSGTIAVETTLQHNGSQCPKITHDGANNKWVYQDITVTAETNRVLQFFTRGDGSVAGLYRIRDLTNAADIVAQTTTGISGTSWQMKVDEYTVPAGCTTVRIFFQSPSSAGDAYFDSAVDQLASDYYYYTEKTTFDLYDLKENYIPVLSCLKNNDIPIIQQLDYREHKASVGGFSIDIIDRNGDISSDWNTNNIYNRSIWVYLGVSDLSYLPDYLLPYKGVCKNWVLENNIITLQIENDTFIVQQNIPEYLTSTDAAAGQNSILPDESQGKCKTIVYGDHIYPFMKDNRPAEDGTDNNYDRANKLTPCRFLGLDQDGDERWLVSGHIAYSLDANNHNIWAFDQALNRLVEVETYVVEQNTSAGAIISCAVEPVLIDYWFPDGTVTEDEDDGGDGDCTTITNSEQCCNLNNENTAVIIVTDSETDGITAPHGYIDVAFPEYQNSGTIETNGVEVKALCYKDNSGPVGTIEINGTQITRDTSKLWVNCGTEADSVAGVESDVRCDVTGLNNVGVGNAETNYLYIYMIYKRIYYKANNRLQLFAGIEGQEYSGTWDSRKTAGNLIEHPTDVFESICRDELGLGDDNIDMVSFDSVNTELASWEFSGSIVERTNSKDVLDELAIQCMSFVYWNADNKVTMDTFYSSNTTNRIFDKNEVYGIPKVYKSELADIVNDLTMSYFKNHEDTLLKQLSRIDDRSSTGSQDVYNAVMKKDLESNFITDSTTIGKLADHWCKDDDDSFWSVLHDIVEVHISCNRGVDFYDSGVFKPTLLLELTDIFELDDADFDSIVKCNGQSWSGKQFKIFYIQRMKQGLMIKGFSV